MSLRRLFITLLLVLAVLGMLGPRGLAWAHSPFEPGSEVASETVPSSAGSDGRSRADVLPGWALAAAPEVPGFPWPVLAIVAAAAALGWWRPRRAAAVALVLLLAVFAFEDGLHSVHHGLDRTQASSCQVAAAGAHLHATPVDGAAPCDVILPVVILAVETSPSDPISPLASPEQGRAPPCSIV
jgi:hypothetical protein